MAKHNACPECSQPLYHATGNSEGREQSETMHRHRTTSPGPQSSVQISSTIVNPFYTGRPRTPVTASKHTPIDRQEIIRRIKSGGSRPTSPELERPLSRTALKKASLKASSTEDASGQPREVCPKTPENLQQDNESIGREIERPRSALHRGDFREKEVGPSAFERFGDGAKDGTVSSLSTSPVAPWHTDFPSAALRRFHEPTLPYQPHESHHARARAYSITSFASGFAYKPPTSPLVQASRPDTPEPPSRRASRSPDKSRRHTFSPHSLQRFGSALEYPTSLRQPPTLRSERTYPYQAHQPRRSLNSSSASLPQTPFARYRRPSIPDSPLQHATLVGSYEESILRGRMSTTPSKPLNFVAQIGVLGKGDCKAGLRCPPHATVPFPAVFYSYGADTRVTTSTDQPSPYVGLIDLENNLPAANVSPEKRSRQRLRANRSDESRASSRNQEDLSTSDAQAKMRRREKQKRRSGSPKAPPGGSYRIPQQGQLQIVIKNPNKTAVKLFLVPYDLSDMEPGQKTFIRQRSYSAGPIIDLPASKSNGHASPSRTDDIDDRPVLRYLVHLHICCPSKGRFFLYKSVRVVFANRVPDGKERLRNDIQLPEPKYSTYKAGRDSNVGLSAATTPRRRSAWDYAGVAFDEGPPSPTRMPSLPPPQFMAQSLPSTEYGVSQPMPSTMAMSPLDLRFARQQRSPQIPEPQQIPTDIVMESQQSPKSTWLSPTSFEERGHRFNGNGIRAHLDEPFEFDRERGRIVDRRDASQQHQNESLLSMRLKHSSARAFGEEGWDGRFS